MQPMQYGMWWSIVLHTIGKLSFSNGETLKLIQSRIAGGGYAADGASLLDEADFTIASLRDTSKGSVPGETFIHELVHQW